MFCPSELASAMPRPVFGRLWVELLLRTDFFFVPRSCHVDQFIFDIVNSLFDYRINLIQGKSHFVTMFFNVLLYYFFRFKFHE